METPEASVISSTEVLLSPLSQMMALADSTSFFLVSAAASCLIGHFVASDFHRIPLECFSDRFIILQSLT